MSRHTLSDGETSDERIIVDEGRHLKILAPPDKLVGGWYRGKLGDGQHTFKNFEKYFAPLYIEHLQTEGAAQTIMELTHLALKQEVWVMCIEDTPPAGEPLLCHRRLLLQHCQMVEPRLSIDIR